MKTESFTCDICEFKTDDDTKVFDAYLRMPGVDAHHFHVCTTCWTETPKGVFQKAFNALVRFLSGK